MMKISFSGGSGDERQEIKKRREKKAHEKDIHLKMTKNSVYSLIKQG